MARNYIGEGKTVAFVADGDVDSGDAVVVGSQLGVALVAVLDGDSGEASVEGVWELAKATGISFAPGDQLAWDVSAGEFIGPADADTDDLVGCAFAYASAETADTTIRARLTPGAGVVAPTAESAAIENLNAWATALATKLNSDGGVTGTDYDTDPQA